MLNFFHIKLQILLQHYYLILLYFIIYLECQNVTTVKCSKFYACLLGAENSLFLRILINKIGSMGFKNRFLPFQLLFVIYTRSFLVCTLKCICFNTLF